MVTGRNLGRKLGVKSILAFGFNEDRAAHSSCRQRNHNEDDHRSEQHFSGNMDAANADEKHHNRCEGEDHDEVVNGDLGQYVYGLSPSVR